MTAEVARLNSSLIIALYSPGDLQYGFVRLGVSFSYGSGSRVRVFRMSSEAKDWLRKTVTPNLTFE